MHYTKTNLESLRSDIDVFASHSHNMKWIQQVGKPVFDRKHVDATQYIKEILQGSRQFDELTILITCMVYNIHCTVLLQGDFWTTRARNEYHDCVIKLAYIGSGVYKEIAPLNIGTDETDEVEKDLAGTGLLQEDSSDENPENPDVTDSRENDFDSEDDRDVSGGSHTDPSNDKGYDDATDENHEQTNVSNEDAQDSQMDVSAGSNTVPSNEDVDPQEQTHEQSNDETNDDALDLTVNDDGYDSDVKITGVSIPDKPNPTIAGRVHRSRSYQCYICQFKSEMQVTFVEHFQTNHKGSPYKCDFCSSSFTSSNGLFKHERSHQYMRYRCDLCGHRMQFPYQMKAHQRTHSHTGLIKCDLCDKHFASDSSKNAHQKSHATQITCDQCPEKKDQKCSHLQTHLRSTYEASMVMVGHHPVERNLSGSPNIRITLDMNVQHARRLYKRSISKDFLSYVKSKKKKKMRNDCMDLCSCSGTF